MRWWDFVAAPLIAGFLVALGRLEARRTLRGRVSPRRARWPTNLGFCVIAGMAVRAVMLSIIVLVAARTQAADAGAVRRLGVSPRVAAAAAFVLLDYTTYLWHRLNHAVPFLWRFHLVHHTDLDLDVTTAIRFHVGEILLSVPFRAAQIVLIGAGPATALAYEGLMNAATLFHHSNWRLPLAVERALNRVLVTPRMHGIHHSIVQRETNSNMSVIFAWWDRVHGTLRLDVPQGAIVIGVPAYRDADELRLQALALLPFARQRPDWSLPDGRHPDRRPRGNASRLAA